MKNMFVRDQAFSNTYDSSSVCSPVSIDQSSLRGLCLQQSVWRAKEVERIVRNEISEPISYFFTF